MLVVLVVLTGPTPLLPVAFLSRLVLTGPTLPRTPDRAETGWASVTARTRTSTSEVVWPRAEWASHRACPAPGVVFSCSAHQSSSVGQENNGKQS